MWTTAKQRKLNELRRLELEGTLTQPQQTQLNRLFDELNQAEQQQLEPQLRKIDAEHKQMAEKVALVKAQNDRLAGVLSRQKALMRRAKEQLRELQRERKQLLSEYTRVMTGSFANRSEISATTKAA